MSGAYIVSVITRAEMIGEGNGVYAEVCFPLWERVLFSHMYIHIDRLGTYSYVHMYAELYVSAVVSIIDPCHEALLRRENFECNIPYEEVVSIGRKQSWS
jgi:hypothetical protein